MIEIHELSYDYPSKRALDNVSFSIQQGSITALVGPNGAGKTTLLRCIAALDDNFSGKIQVAGLDVSDSPREVHQKIGYLSDFFGLYDDLTVEQHLIFAARLHRLPQNDLQSYIDRVVDDLDLKMHIQSKVGSLSRGWRQRLGIAQAIVHQPVLVLLDEPASGLDPEARMELSSLFRLLQAGGMTLIVSSHILAELEDYCTNMLVLRDGKIAGYSNENAGTASRIEMTASNDEAQLRSILSGFAAIENVTIENGTVRFAFSGSEQEQKILLRDLINSGVDVSTFARQSESLQDVYMSLSPPHEGKTR